MRIHIPWVLTEALKVLPEQMMSPDPDQTFPPELELALAHTAPVLRQKLASVFALDQRLGRIVAGTTEPMLGQMRLAWWRDMLSTGVNQRPSGDVVLDHLGQHWEGQEAALIDLVNAWEVFVAAQELTRDKLTEFASGRSAPFAALYNRQHATPPHGGIWALADAASGVSKDEERATLIETGLAMAGRSSKKNRPPRAIAILDALGVRALKRGGRPLMEGRSASLIAMRAALFG